MKKIYVILITIFLCLIALKAFCQNAVIKALKTEYKPAVVKTIPKTKTTNNIQYIKNYQQDGPEKVLMVLDSSYSMNDKIGGERKIDIAKRALNGVLAKLSPNANVGLRVYGHKSGVMGFGACSASELKVPIGPNNLEKIKYEVNKLQPVGATPIIYSIQQALASDFVYSGSGKRRIILLSDGMETCGGSPCDYAVNLVKSGVDLKIDVIGFNLDDVTAQNQLKCVALSTKGKYYSANNASELNNSLIDSLNVQREVQGKILY